MPTPNDQQESVNPAKRAENDETLAEEEKKVNAELAGGNAGDEGEGEKKEDVKPGEGEQQEEKKEEATDADKQDDNKEHSQLSARGQKRVEDLAQKANRVPELEKENERLRKILGIEPGVDGETIRQAGEPKKPEKTQALPWEKQDDGSQTRELTPEEYEADVQKKAEIAAQKVIDNERVAATLRFDVKQSEELYPELRKPTPENPNPQFDQAVVDLISRVYAAEFKQNNKVRLAGIVESVMRIRKQGAVDEQRKRKEALDRQDAEQAIDPSAGGSEQKSANDNIEGKIRGAKSMKDLAALEKLISSGS